MYASFIRFSHTVFALPFALTGALLAARTVPLTWTRVGWILAAMATARTAAMAFNRLVDAKFDAENPRTAGRELPQGLVSSREAAVVVVVASVAFVGTTVMLGQLCLALSPVALAIVFWYSLAKRYTTYTQLFLGLALAVAPVGGWLAAGGRWGWAPWLLAVGTAMWGGGVRYPLRLRGRQLRPQTRAVFDSRAVWCYTRALDFERISPCDGSGTSINFSRDAARPTVCGGRRRSRCAAGLRTDSRASG